MGLFDLFKKPVIIEDNFFGELRFMKIKRNPLNSYFEGKGIFKPIGKEIEYFIDADESGPVQSQRDFYNWVEENYEELTQKAIPLIEEEFKNWQEGFLIKDFKKEFTPVAVSIPRHESKPLKWELSFDTIHDENHQITVHFTDKTPLEIQIDG